MNLPPLRSKRPIRAVAFLVFTGVLFIQSPSAPAASLSPDDPCALPPPERGRQVLLNEAVRWGLADITFDGTDSTTSVGLTVTNRSADPITVHVPTGTPIEPDTPQVQKMISGTNEPITVQPGQTATHRIASYCTENFKDAPPSDGSVALKVGRRTPETDHLTTIAVAAHEMRRFVTEEPDYRPGPMERANPDRFWASVALWSIYRTTDRIGPKEFTEVMERQLRRQTTPEKAAATARRIAQETFEKVDMVYELREIISQEPLEAAFIQPAAKWCGRGREEVPGPIFIKDEPSSTINGKEACKSSGKIEAKIRKQGRTSSRWQKWAKVLMEFIPGTCCKCDKVILVQTIHPEGRSTYVDVDPKESKSDSPFYNYDPKTAKRVPKKGLGKPGDCSGKNNASLEDLPVWNRYKTVRWETCAFCCKGKDAGRFYGCQHWMYDSKKIFKTYDKEQGKVVKRKGRFKLVGEKPKPSKDFLKAHKLKLKYYIKKNPRTKSDPCIKTMMKVLGLK